ncbi:putative DNA mismatch repair protein MutS/MSH [Dioscorea sansibarensis]
MASSRRFSNGRSPLVRKQSQITSFFTPGKGAKVNPDPDPSPDPSPLLSKPKKPLLVIPPSPASIPRTPSSAGITSYKEEVIGTRVRVFWPLDKAWYEGSVRSYDEVSGKHTVQYDDAEEEILDLGSEKIEFLQEEMPRSLRRLRRLSGLTGVATPSTDGNEDSCRDDSTNDEEWGKGMQIDKVDADTDETELEEEEEGVVGSLRRRPSRCSGSEKRKKIESKMLESAKKIKFEDENGKILSKTIGSSPIAPPFDNGEQILDSFDLTLSGDIADRFGKRQAEKFRFLGEGRKDACGRRPGDADYDPKTIHLPQEFMRSLSGGQRQWWEFKSKHMDKVLFFKMGKFYELFEMDAHVGAKELDLQYMKGEQPHCGFPEKNFSINLEKLARKGYRVLVIEQTETPEQLELRRKEMGSKDKVVKREICAMVTKGTLTEGELLSRDPEASYLMSITENHQMSTGQSKEGTVLGICIVDVSTSKFMVGQFEDDKERLCLCSILSELRPVEIIKPAKILTPETESILKNNLRDPLINVLVPVVEFWDAEKTVGEIRNIYQLPRYSQVSGPRDDRNYDVPADSDDAENESGFLPDVLSELITSEAHGSCALSALGGCLFYLRQAFLDEALLKCAKFELLPCSGTFNALQKPYMILDAAALENLEILENCRNGGLSGTLFSQLDHCVTAFGKRLLKSWLARPLYGTRSIIERQDAIAALKGVGLPSALEFRQEFSRLPDVERLLSRLFASCKANGRNAHRVVLYEDAAKKQLQEFISALRCCEVMAQACSTLSTILAKTESTLLHHLLTPGKGLPEVTLILRYFKGAFDWSEADISGRIIPHEGCDVEFDTACNTLNDIESSLKRYLKEQRKVLGDASIDYVSVGKEIYLLEVPESLSGIVPREYELRSSKKGYFRYWTPEIKEFLGELSQAEADKESKLKNILQRLIRHFSRHHKKWRRLVSMVAELDVLISIAIASDYYEGPACRPCIKERHKPSETLPYLSAKGLGHPVLRSDILGKGSFVPNDISVGGAGCPSFILLTGPNMGGKSTLLRQVCLAIILAQIGADVPAESFELSPVDRIFVRMGARDNIMAGQSTFLTELSETAAMLSLATHNSFAALDELGRGTSTSDGQAIAGSVLEYFVRNTQCRGLFSTHYHRLAVDYEKDSKISVCHMACQVGKGIGGTEEVTFLYKLMPGPCARSFGVNVARLAGIPTCVLEKATAKSSEFESTYGKNQHVSNTKFSTSIKDDEVTVIKDLLHATKSWNHLEDSQALNLSLLSEIQRRARLLVPGS